MSDCLYCCQALPDSETAWCPACKSRQKPLSLMPGVQIFSRIGARLLDLCVFEAIVSALTIPIVWLDPGNALLQLYVRIWALLGPVAFLPFVEAWCLSQWGYTPGKWLMKIEVMSPSQQPPTFSMALRRVLKLYHQLGYFVLALGVVFAVMLTIFQANNPGSSQAVSMCLLITTVLVVIAHYRAYYHYRKSDGHTMWDSDLGLRVQHRVLRFEHAMVATLSFLLLRAASEYMAHWPDITPHPGVMM
jgi:uncharacterized RDD family membrane protein YckC